MIERWQYFVEVMQHPLNSGRVLDTLLRCARWTLGGRLVGAVVAMPFVNNTVLLMQTGMRGLTENVYVGLSEFEDMGFVLHVLRQDDVFVDVGANAGAYTVLASGVVGASSISFEPLPAAFDQLLQNITHNRIASRVDARRCAIGRVAGTVRMTVSLDVQNHVVRDEADWQDVLEVPVLPLDEALGELSPTFIKIDVEGFEGEVISGAVHTLTQPTVKAVIVETNDSGRRYGSDVWSLDQSLLSLGFERCAYDPLSRKIRSRESPGWPDGRNTLYVRDRAELQIRAEAAAPFCVNGRFV